VLSSFLHSWSFFYLMCNEGAVNTGILQALRAVMVFITSAILYCDEQESQCYTKFKFMSTCIVVFGVYCYAKVSPRPSHNTKT